MGQLLLAVEGFLHLTVYGHSLFKGFRALTMLYEIRGDNDDCKPWPPGFSSFTGMVMWGCRAGTSLHEREVLAGDSTRHRTAGKGGG
jgi:hypothetical protein